MAWPEQSAVSETTPTAGGATTSKARGRQNCSTRWHRASARRYPTESDIMIFGTVKMFNASRGFGFLRRDDNQPDVFVHISDLERSGLGELSIGARVEFLIEQDRRSGKTKATDIRVIGRGSNAAQ
jgi:CspA family cold shock protein